MTVPHSWLGQSCLTIARQLEEQGLCRLDAVSRACASKYGTEQYFEMHRSERARSGWDSAFLEICRLLSVDVPNKEVLVVGVNDGADVELFRSCDVIGVDPCHEALAVARANLPSHRFHVGLAESLPLMDKSVDVYMALRVVNCTTVNLVSALVEFRRVLKPIGSFIFSIANGFYEGDHFIQGLFKNGMFDPMAPQRVKEELLEGLQRMGLRAVTLDTVAETFIFGEYVELYGG